MSNMMCNACHKVGEPYKVPSCSKPECPANGFARMVEPLLADPLERRFNGLLKAVTEAGVIPSRLDWFKAGYYFAKQQEAPAGVEQGGGNG